MKKQPLNYKYFVKTKTAKGFYWKPASFENYSIALSKGDPVKRVHKETGAVEIENDQEDQPAENKNVIRHIIG